MDYPIAVDSDYAIWGAFANHYWPAVYIADAEGRIRFHHFGEGEYAMTEMVIQQLLLAAGATASITDLVSVEPRGLEVAADWRTLAVARDVCRLRPEHRLREGSRRRRSTSPASTRRRTAAPQRVGASGHWTVAGHAAVLNEPGGRIAFRFRARDLNLVMGPPSRGVSIPFRVFLDGQPADRRSRDRRGRGRQRDGDATSARTS